MATTQEQLDEAIAVRHAWRTGKTKASVTHGDRQISYSIEGMKRLDEYIAELRRTLAGTARRGRNRIQYVTPA
ncbi:MAG TPA: gpW family head-tail joining protein [Luteimonas sp.]|nr:gpW family head-tail joining protein [Luteimonas sp.]